MSIAMGYTQNTYHLSDQARCIGGYVSTHTALCGDTDSHVGAVTIYLGGNTGCVSLHASAAVLREIAAAINATAAEVETAVAEQLAAEVAEMVEVMTA